MCFFASLGSIGKIICFFGMGVEYMGKSAYLCGLNYYEIYEEIIIWLGIACCCKSGDWCCEGS